MAGPLNGPGVRDAILKHGKSTTEAAAYFWGNVTKSVQDSTKGVVTVDSGRRMGVGSFKAGKDFARGDTLCGSLCCISIGCEAAAGILIWIPLPGKITTVATLKAISIGTQRYRDMCAADPFAPNC